MANVSEASQQANRSGMDPKRLVVIFYLVAGLIFALFMEHVLALIWAQFGLPDPEFIEGLQWRATTILGVLVAVAIGVGCYLHPRIRQISMEVATELMRVTSPCLSETWISYITMCIPSHN